MNEPENPYGSEPQPEFPMCTWCRWSTIRAYEGAQCHSPRHGVVKGVNYWPCEKVNGNAQCRVFEPSFLTRLLRKVGLRRSIYVGRKEEAKVLEHLPRHLQLAQGKGDE